jgi:hypothetical protein
LSFFYDVCFCTLFILFCIDADYLKQIAPRCWFFFLASFIKHVHFSSAFISSCIDADYFKQITAMLISCKLLLWCKLQYIIHSLYWRWIFEALFSCSDVVFFEASFMMYTSVYHSCYSVLTLSIWSKAQRMLFKEVMCIDLNGWIASVW